MSLSLALQSATGLVVAGALAGIIAPSIDVSPIAPPDRGVAALPSEPQNVQGIPSLQPITLREVFERPLFAQDRRPYAPPAPPPAPVPITPVREVAPPRPRLPDLSLLGVALLRGRSVALVRDEETGSAEWVRVGDRIDSLEIRTITSRTVTLGHSDGEVTLELWSKTDAG